MNPIMLSILTISALFSSRALAQDDAAAGLFHEARQLPMVSQSMTLRVASGEASLHIVQVFSNDGQTINQADYHLYLPDQASVTSYGFWRNGRFLEARLREKEDASARHSAAAASGKSSTIMHREGQIHSFSVNPVEAGALAQIETTIRIPVHMELGKNHVRLPIDAFLGQSGPGTSLTVQLDTDEDLTDFGVAGRDAIVLSQDSRSAHFAWSGSESVDVWWQEDVPDMLLRADVADIGDGRDGVRLRIVMDDAPVESDADEVHVLVDGSFSMRRRIEAIELITRRLEKRSQSPVTFHVLGTELRGLSAHHTTRAIQDGSGPHSLSWSEVETELSALSCSPKKRCLVLTDAQLSGISESEQSGVEAIVLADPHERAHFEEQIPASAVLVDPDQDAEAKMLALADQLVVPTLRLNHVETLVDQQTLELIEGQPVVVAEGGLLRVFGTMDSGTLIDGDSLRLYGKIDDQDQEWTVPIRRVSVNSHEAKAVRHGAWMASLQDMIRDYRDAPSVELRDQIVAISLRENIPTSFTSLQVTDPSLSIAAIKGGDPILSVGNEVGLTDVVAWYPFGDTRRLRGDDTGFSDRFLAPRYWTEQPYRVDIFKHYADGSVAVDDVWYVIDDRAPTAQVSIDGDQLVVTSIADGPTIGSVVLYSTMRVIQLERDTDSPRWSVPTRGLPREFSLVVRDKAGNRTALQSSYRQGELILSKAERAIEAPQTLAQRHLTLSGGNQTLSIHDGIATLQTDQTWRFDARELELHSLMVTSVTELDDSVLVGTRGGDLFRLSGNPSRAQVVSIPTGQIDHPVTGIAQLSDGSILVGVLGAGLLKLTDDQLVPAEQRITSRFITGLAPMPSGDVLVATGYAGVWRVTERGSKRTRFPYKNAIGIEVQDGELLVHSGAGVYRYRSDRSFEHIEAGLNHLDIGAEDLVGAVELGGEVIVAGLDSGLHTLRDGRLHPLALGLSISESRINDLIVHQDALWLATEGGLVRVDATLTEATSMSESVVYDVDGSALGVAVAAKDGLWVLRPGETMIRIDTDGEIAKLSGSTGSFTAAEWHDGAIYAGGMEGLYRYDWFSSAQVLEGFGSRWVTALHSDGSTLYAGTYASGVYEVSGAEAQSVVDLSDQWVPPNGLTSSQGTLFVGGIGMDPVMMTRGFAQRVSVPARDVSRVVAIGDELIWVTSDGVFLSEGLEDHERSGREQIAGTYRDEDGTREP
jgi:hypothetical protein